MYRSGGSCRIPHYFSPGSASYVSKDVNASLLIDAIVRQTTVLIASLATAAGRRAPLAHVADQVFGDLVRELKDQGLGNKVIADMFGMALRTYQSRVARLSESRTEQGKSLWAAILAYVQARGQVSRAEVQARFHRDDEAMVRGVLRDLVSSGLVGQDGRADQTMYGAAQVDAPESEESSLDALVLVAVHRNGPAERAALLELVPVDEPGELDAALARLIDQGSVQREDAGATTHYHCSSCVIPFGAAVGWEAAVFDHYQALVTALVTKLRHGKRRADLSDRIGGSTFVFDLWDGHPMADQVLGTLQAMREHGVQLRQALEAYNEANARPPDRGALRVVSYVGQTVQAEDEADAS